MREAFALAAVAALVVGPAYAGTTVSSDGKIVTSTSAPSPTPPDFLNAKPLPMPRSRRAPPAQWRMIRDAAGMNTGSTKLISQGADGDGTLKPETVPQSKYLPPNDGGVTSQEYGSSNQPYTTSRATGVNASPYRKSGKLFFQEGSSTFVCTASLVKPGIIATAAHCVANFGKSQFYSNWVYIPSYSNGNAPFGTWAATSARVLTSYYNGTDSCAQSGVICQDDVATLTVVAQSGRYPGTQTGFFSVGVNGYGFVNGQALISQLGYPVALDSGGLMQRTDSQGSVASASLSNNTIIGSLQTGGSSGGPWVVNLGTGPKLASGVGYGNDFRHDTLVGVTSWGYTDASSSGPKQAGASPFLASNIQALINASCSTTPSAC